jgi:hypothetical protein
LIPSIPTIKLSDLVITNSHGVRPLPNAIIASPVRQSGLRPLLKCVFGFEESDGRKGVSKTTPTPPPFANLKNPTVRIAKKASLLVRQHITAWVKSAAGQNVNKFQVDTLPCSVVSQFEIIGP